RDQRRDEHQQQHQQARETSLRKSGQVLAVRLAIEELVRARNLAGSDLPVEVGAETVESDAGQRRVQAGADRRLPQQQPLADFGFDITLEVALNLRLD